MKGIIVLMAECYDVFDVVIKPSLEKGVLTSDIKYARTNDELKRYSVLAPFFSSKLILYVYVNKTMEIKRIKFNERIQVVYIFTTIPDYDKFKKTKMYNELNFYLMDRDIFNAYVNTRLLITEEGVQELHKRIGYQVKYLTPSVNDLADLEVRIDEKIVRKIVPKYAVMSFNKFFTYLLLGERSLQCLKYIYKYRYNPRFLLKLFHSSLDLLIEEKLKYVNGEFNRFNIDEYCKINHMSIYSMRTKLELFEKLDLFNLYEIKNMLEITSSNFRNYVNLIKFYKLQFPTEESRKAPVFYKKK